MSCASATLRARESPRRERSRSDVEPGDAREHRRRRGRRRSGRRPRARKPRDGSARRARRAARRARPSRSTVATTRSKRRSERLRPPAQATLSRAVAPAPRVRRPRSPRRRADDRGGGRERARPDASATSSSSSSTTARPTRTGRLAARSTTPVLRLVRNDEPLGLAGALNVGLDAARGGVRRAHGRRRRRSCPHGSSATLGRLRAGLERRRRLGDDRPGRGRAPRHGPPDARRPRAVRWAALFSSPFFHSTVVVDRAMLDRHGLRYDTSFGESEDYDLWARLLGVADGDNVPDAWSSIASTRRRRPRPRAELQRECQRRVALRQIGALVPELEPDGAELAWLRRCGPAATDGTVRAAADALGGSSRRVRAPPRGRRGAAGRGRGRSPGHGPRRAATVRARDAGARGSIRRCRHRRLPAAGARNAARSRAGRRRARGSARQRTRPSACTLVLPEPTPVSAPRCSTALATRPELDLTVALRGGTSQRRTWTIEPRHRAVFLEDVASRACTAFSAMTTPFRSASSARSTSRDARGRGRLGLEHVRVAGRARLVPAHRVPYVLLVESNERDARAGLAARGQGRGRPADRAGRGARCSSSGTLARRVDARARRRPDRISLVRGHDRRRGFGCGGRPAARAAGGSCGPRRASAPTTSPCSPSRGSRRRRARHARSRRSRSGPTRASSCSCRRRAGARAARVARGRARCPPRSCCPTSRGSASSSASRSADVFALLSRHEPWGVVVNEAAACGLPLVLSDRRRSRVRPRSRTA